MSINIKVPRTMRNVQVTARLHSQGFTHIGILDNTFQTEIDLFLGRHADAIFIPTISNNIFIMVSSLVYVLKATKEASSLTSLTKDLFFTAKEN